MWEAMHTNVAFAFNTVKKYRFGIIKMAQK